MPYEINPKYKNVNDLVDNIESYCLSSNRIIYDQRNVIFLVNFEDHDYVVKSFKQPNIINRIAYRYFRASKAKRSFQYSLILGSDITPTPIAYIENVESYFLGKSYYISKYFNYDYTIHEVLIDKKLEDRSRILEQFASFTYKLHEGKILHHDYSHGNILIKKPLSEDENYIFKIIDINRMEFITLSMNKRLDNFSRINADDSDMKIIMSQYAKLTDANPEVAFEKAKFYRDDFYKKRAIKNKLRGKA